MKRPLEIALENCSRFGMKPGLDAMRRICTVMGDPQDCMRVVHVAGTNGKGAVCALVDSALRAAGFKVGRYTSPHLVELNERFSINGIPATDDMLDEAFSRVRDAMGRLRSGFGPSGMEGQVRDLTYFELLTAMAFDLYARAGVDYLVLETGLGGRLDATNVVQRPEVCAITRIGLDHCDWLGGTVKEIAREKGGIVKQGVPVVLGAMPEDARIVLEGIAQERAAPCTYAPEVVDDAAIPPGLALGGLFNRENAATAMAVLSLLGIGTEAVAEGFATVRWPGRYQIVDNGGRKMLVDGAHNPPAMRALVASIEAGRARMPQLGRTAICGFCGDKDVSANLALLGRVADAGIAVPIRNPRSLPTARTAELMRAAGFRSVKESETLEDALSDAPDGAVVCGSLFLAGEALELLGGCMRRPGAFTPNETIRPILS